MNPYPPEKATTSDSSGNGFAAKTGLHRGIGWKGAFWIASGAPGLVLFTIGAVAATVGKPAWIVWLLSIGFGFIQAFTYAEIAGMFPHKSGGLSIHSSVAWMRYSKFIATLNVWCNWAAWSPVLAIGSGLAAGYSLSILYDANSLINTWQITLLDLGMIKSGLSLRINATFILGATFLLLVFAVQHGGILRSVNTTMILGLIALVPLILIGLIPLITGDVAQDHFFPFLPLAYDIDGNVIEGNWDIEGWKLMAGGLFVAAWSSYGFETALCYTREFKNPKTDTYKAIIYSGLLCIVVFTLVPIAFQSHLGLGELVVPAVVDDAGEVKSPAIYDGMLAANIYKGTGVANALSSIVGGGAVIGNIIVVMLILTLLLAIMTTMSGSSRTLYQASVDGLLPKYLSVVNESGSPTRAMWTDLSYNLILLMMSDYVFVLAASNVAYIIYHFLVLNSAWIHRMDRPHWDRPYKTPMILLVMGVLLGFLNLAIMGMGTEIWGEGTLKTGLFFSSLIVPLFIYRHYFEDKGVFPSQLISDMQPQISRPAYTKYLEYMPYLSIAAAIILVWYTDHI
ncbi:MAG: APC family permease [Methylophilus sp.]|uniref:APC family permease n=1 Tax=Methylophilus sp. TaxID=29541 RepID=UPI003FA15D40